MVSKTDRCGRHRSAGGQRRDAGTLEVSDVTPPDVSVIIAVYNTMPYLTRCLTSLVNQTIGVARLEVISGRRRFDRRQRRELDRFAGEYPGVVKVIHQRNSGGPAAPSNRGLDAANRPVRVLSSRR